MHQMVGRLGGLLGLLLLAACSGNLRDVTGQPPQAALDGLERRDNGIIVELALRNVNDAALKLNAVSLTLELDGRQFVSGRRELPLFVSARGREVIRMPLPADRAGIERLDALSSAQVERLPWHMEVSLELADSADQVTETNGWLHRVPGQPDRFR